MPSCTKSCRRSTTLLDYGTEKDGYINYMKGANIAGFMKVAKSMVEQGIL
mgnify:CR=1 FL=1